MTPDRPGLAALSVRDRVAGWSTALAGSAEPAGGRNMLLLTQLRWLAVAGQLVTVLFVHFWMGVPLPLVAMLAVIAGLLVLNVATILVFRHNDATNLDLFGALLLDFAALSVQLYWSGGAANPFVSLYLLQVVLGAVLLDAWSSWALVVLSSAAFALLAGFHRTPILPARYASSLSGVQIFASWLTYVLAAVLLVFFVTRISANLRARDAHLVEMRERAAEEDHIVRMGLLASGAAHELGTPLSTLAVILGDWTREPALAADPRLAEEIAEMQAEVLRCKAIVGDILFAAGEVRGEAPVRTTLTAFVTAVARQWDALHPGLLTVEDRVGAELWIVSDQALAKVIAALLDNAAEAGATAIRFAAERNGALLALSVGDDGRGFPAEMLATVGRPYQTTKPRGSGGLGLFLAVNVLRKLGGEVTVARAPTRGTRVTLTLPIAALALETAA
jgi:two-component system sensor histidine kinase RegB